MLAQSKVGTLGVLVLFSAPGCMDAIDRGSQPAAVSVTRAPLVATNCSDDQADLLQRAADDARGAIFNARVAASGVLAGNNTSRYENWFGEPTEDRVATVAKHFDDAFAVVPQAFYECLSSCGPGEYAVSTWTNPGMTPEDPIRICPIYFDPKQPYSEVSVGVLVHEYMHLVGFQDVHDPFCSPGEQQNLTSDPDYTLIDPEAYRMFALDWNPSDSFERVDCH